VVNRSVNPSALARSCAVASAARNDGNARSNATCALGLFRMIEGNGDAYVLSSSEQTTGNIMRRVWFWCGLLITLWLATVTLVTVLRFAGWL
jgi:hypothetical protein